MALDMTLRGVRTDHKARADVARELVETAKLYSQRLEHYIPEWVFPRQKGESAWFRSPAQTMELLYDYLGVKEIHKRIRGRRGPRTCEDSALETIGKRHPELLPLMDALREYRSLEKFVDIVQMQLSSDGRMRCAWNVANPETFRWSSSEDAFGDGGNLQTLPKGTEEE